MSDFGTDPLPRRLRGLYGAGLVEAVRAGRVQWRLTGTTHLELRDVVSGRRLTVASSAESAASPAAQGKVRTLLRRAEGGEP